MINFTALQGWGLYPLLLKFIFIIRPWTWDRAWRLKAVKDQPGHLRDVTNLPEEMVPKEAIYKQLRESHRGSLVHLFHCPRCRVSSFPQVVPQFACPFPIISTTYYNSVMFLHINPVQKIRRDFSVNLKNVKTGLMKIKLQLTKGRAFLVCDQLHFCISSCLVVAVQSSNCVWLFVTRWTAALQASLSLASPGVCPSSCPLSQWCHPTTSAPVTLFSCPQSFPASGSFPVCQLFASGGQSNRSSAS